MKPVYYFLIPMLVLSCEKNSEERLPSKPVQLELTEKAAKVIESDNTFGFNMLRQVIENDDAENILISPTSIALALAMTYNGAEGETKTAFETALLKQGLTREEINECYKSLIDALKSVDRKVLFEIVNSIWYKENFNVLPDFINVNSEFYNAEVSSLDFTDPFSIDIINKWVDESTHGLIAEIIKNIPADAVMYLINAIYFKGMWKYEFEESETMESFFYLKNGEIIYTDFLNQATTLPMTVNEKVMMVELPYGQGNYSMVVLMPNNKNSTEDIISMLNRETWDSWISELDDSNVNIVLPKFKFSYQNLLNNELVNLGMGIAFSDMADFSGIDGTGELKISRVMHKSFIEVDEEGTEAAAVTAVEIAYNSSGTSNYPFIVNRPFIFAIRETTTGAVLFLGRVQNPVVENNGVME